MHIAFRRVRRKTSPAAAGSPSSLKCLFIYLVYHSC